MRRPRKAGGYIKELRSIQGLTQKELEQKCGFSPGFIGRLERGEVKRIAIPDVYAVASALKKFKRKTFEELGMCELQITEVKSDLPTPKSQTVKPKTQCKAPSPKAELIEKTSSRPVRSTSTNRYPTVEAANRWAEAQAAARYSSSPSNPPKSSEPLEGQSLPIRILLLLGSWALLLIMALVFYSIFIRPGIGGDSNSHYENCAPNGTTYECDTVTNDYP